MIKQILENAIISIESQRNNEIQTAKNIAIQQKINPFNVEIDDAYKNAVNELALKFEQDKKALFEAGEKKKSEHKEKIMQEITNNISYKYDLSIAKLKKQIEELGE